MAEVTYTVLTVIAAVVVLVVGATIAVRFMVRNRMLLQILEPTRYISSVLVKGKPGDTIEIGKGEDREKYILLPSKLFWKMYPPGLPSWLQDPIQTAIYVRNKPEPVDPYNTSSIITAKTLRIISDEAMMRQTWKDAREAAGVKTRMGANTLTILVIIAIALGLVSVYFNFQMSGKVDEVLSVIRGVYAG